MSVGQAFFRIRQEKGLTQNDVAAAAGLATSYVSRIENDHVQPTMATVQRLAESLGVPLSRIFEIEERGDRAAQQTCPVSSSGQCIGEQIRSHRGRAPTSRKRRYSKEELRLLRMTDFLVTSGSAEARRALGVVLEALVDRTRRA